MSTVVCKLCGIYSTMSRVSLCGHTLASTSFSSKMAVSQSVSSENSGILLFITF